MRRSKPKGRRAVFTEPPTRSELDAGQQQPGAARPAVLLQQGIRQPEGRERGVRHRARFHHSTDGGKTFVNVDTPHGDNHVVWFNPDNPKIFIETNDGGANITQDGGRSWSSIINQPTAEMYMVDADEQFPYSIYGPQQDTGKNLTVPSFPPTAWGPDDPRQLWVPAPGCESGQVRPIPSGKIVYGDCKGEFGRMNVETGQEQNYWINPQQRYGKKPKDMMFRFVRQSPIEVDAHNPKSCITARSTCTKRLTAAFTGRSSAPT